MDKFFLLTSTESINKISTLEKIIPIFITIFLIIIIFISKRFIIKKDNIDKSLRLVFGSISCLFLMLYYCLLWTSQGVTPTTLPLHLCFISNILAILLCIYPNKKICTFTLFTGVLGGISSLLFPDLQLSSNYFRYYQFMVCHISIIIIPIYISLIYNFKIYLVDALKSFILLNLVGIPIGIFNELYRTNYMFISFTSSFAADGSILIDIIGTEHYFILLELFIFSIMLIMYLAIFLSRVIKVLLNSKRNKKITYIKA